jgi:hypothetical protein
MLNKVTEGNIFLYILRLIEQMVNKQNNQPNHKPQNNVFLQGIQYYGSSAPDFARLPFNNLSNKTRDKGKHL